MSARICAGAQVRQCSFTLLQSDAVFSAELHTTWRSAWHEQSLAHACWRLLVYHLVTPTPYSCPCTWHMAGLCAGECSAEELERLMTIVANPRQYKIPDWFLNRQKDHKTGRFTQVSALPARCGGTMFVHVQGIGQRLALG